MSNDKFHGFPMYEEFYEINKNGVVRSKPRYVNSPICGGKRLRPGGKIRTNQIKGYWGFTAVSQNGKRKTVYVHRALAQIFISNPQNKPCINHIDGDKTNNDIDNLEWCTHKENMQHAFRIGLVPYPQTGKGEKSPSSKLTTSKVLDIKRRLKNKEPHRSIALLYRVSGGTIGFIARGETWAHI